MTANGTSPLTLADLERILQTADPATVLVAPRLLRRVIRHVSGVGIALSVPHRKSLVIARATLLAVVDREELGLAPGRDLLPTVILFARPDPEKLAALPRGEALLKFWRRLFHAAIHVAFDRLLAEHQLTAAAFRERIHRIGQSEFDEIRAVLRQENYLLAPEDPAQVYSEFAALYLELRYFARPLLHRYFPTLEARDLMDAVLARDVDADRLYAATRLEGAPDPCSPAPIPDENVPPPIDPEEGPPTQVRRSGRLYRLLTEKADQVAGVGNVVRAALLRTRAVRVAPQERVETARAAARGELERLSRRLQAALGCVDSAAEEWRRALAPLLERASRGVWPVEARLLYDLQQACIDHERPVYAVDLVDWMVSLGKRPLQRPLPNQRDVLRVKHLRRASGRLTAARLSDRARRRLAGLLATAVERSEAHLREQFRPRLVETLQDAEMQPRNLPERVAFNKLSEELLDRVSERGFLTLGDLRDAVSGNRLKLPDLAGPIEFFRGDRLLQSNRRLAQTLDGVYHGGEVYLRWLERLSALAFGTRPGRFLTRYLLLPFGGAYAALEGIQHLILLGLRLVAPETELELATPVSVAVLGTLLLALINSADFRQQVVRTLRVVWGGVCKVLIDLPAFVLGLPLVRRVLASQPFRILKRYFLKPLALTVVTAPVLVLAGSDVRTTIQASALLFLAALVFLNSRWGRTAEEVVADWFLRHWRYLHLDIFPALVRFVLDLFRRLLEELDRVLYTVDEWLRFRRGESRLAFAGKLVLSSVWCCVTYLIRFYVNVFLEPQINPIKHFPAVTVGAKIIFPFSLMLADFMAGQLMPLGTQLAHAIAYAHVLLLPGLFGFLVWELKANWRLYAANQPPVLQPVPIGHHGETMLRLLKPGFHSGTLPKSYRKLRRGERRADGRAVRKQRKALEQVEESLRHFVERELLSLLGKSQGWGVPTPAVTAIVTGSNRVRMELCCPSLSETGLRILFEEQSGWLLGSIAEPGWLFQLAPEQRRAWRTALTGFYKLAGVDLIREQIEASLLPAAPAYDIADEGLVVWPGTAYEVEVVYDLRNGPFLQPHANAASLPLPALPAVPLLFRQVPILWRAWVDAWESDQAGAGLPDHFLEGVRLLPLPAEAKSRT